MMKMNAVRLFVSASILAMLTLGCAKPPVDEKKAAEAALNNAVAAQANLYSGSIMDDAKKIFDDAQAKMISKSYKEAKIAFISAKEKFEAAISGVEEGKKAMIESNKEALKALEENVKLLVKSAVPASIKKLDANLKQTWSAESKQIQENLKKAKDTKAAPSDIKNILDGTKEMVDKWLGTFKK